MPSIFTRPVPEEKLSQSRYGVKVEKDVFVKMPDGIELAVDVYRPDAPGTFPSLLACSCYQKDLVYLPAVTTFHMRETNDIDWFVQRGYAYVNADLRGTGKSGGVWKFHSYEEQRDMYELIEWIARQGWCSGKVGMIGESYYAWTQWFAAAMQPPHLATIVPWDGGADMYRDVVFHGGLVSMGFLTWWHFNLRANHLMDLPGPHPPEKMSWDMVYEVLKHPTFDAFWEERRADFKKIKVPVYSIGIWHKVGLHLRGNLRGFEELEVPKKLMVCHGDYVGDEMEIFGSLEMRLELLRWYDHWLKGNDTGMMEEPPVRLFVRGSDFGYREEQEWPLQRTRYTRFYLNPGPSGAGDSLNDGGLSPAQPGKEQLLHIRVSGSDLERLVGHRHRQVHQRAAQSDNQDPHLLHRPPGCGPGGDGPDHARPLRLLVQPGCGSLREAGRSGPRRGTEEECSAAQGQDPHQGVAQGLPSGKG